MSGTILSPKLQKNVKNRSKYLQNRESCPSQPSRPRRPEEPGLLGEGERQRGLRHEPQRAGLNPIKLFIFVTDSPDK